MIVRDISEGGTGGQQGSRKDCQRFHLRFLSFTVVWLEVHGLRMAAGLAVNTVCGLSLMMGLSFGGPPASISKFRLFGISHGLG
jgi:hypothetical protein